VNTNLGIAISVSV